MKKRRPTPPLLPSKVATFLLSVLFSFYWEEVKFRQEVEELFARHSDLLFRLLKAPNEYADPPARWELLERVASGQEEAQIWGLDSEAARLFQDDLEALGKRWGIDRIPNGIPALLYNLVECSRYDRIGGLVYPWTSDSSELSAKGLGFLQFPPVLRVNITRVWQRWESPAEVRRRILEEAAKQLDEQLRYHCERAVKGGFVFPDTAPKWRDHLRWLFQHIALGKTYPEIAASELDDKSLKETVKRAVWSLANGVNIRLR